MPEITPLRVGLIGCGDISGLHLKSYAKCGIQVAALCDLIPQRAERRRDEFNLAGVPIYTDYHELLARADIDFITNATPVAEHAPITIAALQAGKHVACEKPSTLSIKQNKAVIAAATKAGKKVIFFSSRMRWGDAVLAREFINNGDLGDIYRVHVQYFRRRGRPGVDVIPTARWFANRKLSGGGVVMDMGQYFMDMVLDLTGWPKIDAVSATTFQGFPYTLPKGVPFDVEEHCTILARSGRKLSFTFDFAWISHHPDTTYIMILGTKGGIRMDRDGFHFHTERGGPWRYVDTGSTWKDQTSGNDHVYEDFSQAIRGNDPGIGTTPQQALAISELTQMALQSADKGWEVKRSELT